MRSLVRELRKRRELPARGARLVPLAVGLLAAAGLAWSMRTSQSFQEWRSAPPLPLDARYATLRAALPEDARLGYVSDADAFVEPGLSRYYQAQYALAPKIVVREAGPRYIVANLVDPARLPSLCERFELEPVAVFDRGVALLRRRGRP